MPKLLTRKSTKRLPGYDYAQSNYYFITAGTENKREWFGEIKNNEMVLNPYGKICLDRLQNLPHHYKNINIDTFVIMPNHIHGIIRINHNRNGHYQRAQNIVPLRDND